MRRREPPRASRRWHRKLLERRGVSPATRGRSQDPEHAIGERLAADRQSFQRRLATHPAGAGGEEVTLQGSKVGQHPRSQFDVDDVVPLLLADVAIYAIADLGHLRPPRDDAFSEEEPGGQLEVAPRCPHGDRNRPRLPPRSSRISRGSSPATASMRSTASPPSCVSTRTRSTAPRRPPSSLIRSRYSRAASLGTTPGAL